MAPRRADLASALVLAFLTGAASGVHAAPTAAPPAAASRIRPDAGRAAAAPDTAEMGAFVDGLVEGLLRTHHVPGAVVSVVRDGKLVLARGYGFADLERGIPMSAESTLVRPGSISKLFTWTAVMQLAERRRVDLNTDIRAYVPDVPIARFPGEPVTLAHLLTHTPGFEDRGEGLFVRRAEEIRPLREYLRRYAPARIYPAGRVPAYSNYGSALAGYVVESVSGEPFQRYAGEHILRPLGMARSTFRQPPDGEDARGRLAKGYSYRGGAWREESEWVQPAPTGGLSTTATDMARFMIAMLDRGAAPGGARILSDSTAAVMQQRHFASDPRAGGWTYGFMETSWNGRRVLRHDGDLFFHHSALVLIPAGRAGVFVSFNAGGGAAAREAFLEAFFDRFLPDTARTRPAPVAAPAADLRACAGTYLPSRHNETGVERLMNLQIQAEVQPTERGTLRTAGIGSTRPARDAFEWVQVEPRGFRRADGRSSLLFRTDPRGRVVEIVDANDPGSIYLRQPWYATGVFALLLLLGCIVVFVPGATVGPVRALLRRHAGIVTASTLPPWLPWLGWLVSALSLVFLVAFTVLMMDPEIVFRVPPALPWVLRLPALIAIPAAALLSGTAAAWAGRLGTVGQRWSLAAVALAGAAFVGWLHQWNLLFYAWR